MLTTIGLTEGVSDWLRLPSDCHWCGSEVRVRVRWGLTGGRVRPLATDWEATDWQRGEGGAAVGDRLAERGGRCCRWRPTGRRRGAEGESEGVRLRQGAGGRQEGGEAPLRGN